MFISPISFSLVSNKPQKTAKYDSLPRLNDLNADTVTFTGVQKFTSKAARKARKGKRLTGQIQNPMEAAMQEAKDKAARAVTFGYDEMKKMLVDFVIYEPEGKIVIGEPHTKQEADAMLKILGIRAGMLDYIGLVNKGYSGLSETEKLQRKTEIQLLKDKHGKTLEYLSKLSDESDELGDDVLEQFYTRMQLENVNPNRNMTTEELIDYIKGCKFMLDSDPLEMAAIQNGMPTIRSVIESVMQPVKQVIDHAKSGKPVEVKPEVVKTEKVKPEKVKKEKAPKVKKEKPVKTEAKTVAKEKTISQMSKSEAQAAIKAKFIKYLRQHVNIYRDVDEQQFGHSKAGELIGYEFLEAFQKYPNLFNFVKKDMDRVADVFNHKSKLIDRVPIALNNSLVEMTNGIKEMNTYRANISEIEEKLAKNHVRNKAKLRAELKENQDKLEETRSIWSDYLRDVVEDENINRQSCIERGLGNEYDYLTSTNKELCALKKWEQARQENGGVISEDTWTEITKFYGEYIDPLYARREPVVHVTKFAFNRW